GRLVHRPASTRHGGPVSATRPYEGRRPATHRPPHRSYDHRYARPDWHHVRAHPRAYAPPPSRTWYRPYYPRSGARPYHRCPYATPVVVAFVSRCVPLAPASSPPCRSGWTWLPGLWVGTLPTPGDWAPVTTAPIGYVYVPGFPDGTVYVDGFC